MTLFSERSEQLPDIARADKHPTLRDAGLLPTELSKDPPPGAGLVPPESLERLAAGGRPDNDALGGGPTPDGDIGVMHNDVLLGTPVQGLLELGRRHQAAAILELADGLPRAFGNERREVLRRERQQVSFS